MPRGVYPRLPNMKSYGKVRRLTQGRAEREESIRRLYWLLKDPTVHPNHRGSGSYVKVGRLLGVSHQTVLKVVKGGKKDET